MVMSHTSNLYLSTVVPKVLLLGLPFIYKKISTSGSITVIHKLTLAYYTFKYNIYKNKAWSHVFNIEVNSLARGKSAHLIQEKKNIYIYI